MKSNILILFKKNDFEIVRKQGQYSQVTVKVPKGDLQKFFEDISKYNIKFLEAWNIIWNHTLMKN